MLLYQLSYRTISGSGWTRTNDQPLKRRRNPIKQPRRVGSSVDEEFMRHIKARSNRTGNPQITYL